MGDHNRTIEAQDNFKEKRKPRGEIKFNIHLNEEQKEAKRLIIESEIVIITGRAGCLSYGTKVLMYDTSYKEVQDIVVGDLLMGVDSTPRKVLNLVRGQQQMYWVKQKKGLDYRVNEDHILSLTRNTPAKYHRKTVDGKRVFDYNSAPISDKVTEIVNISVKDYLNLPSRVANKQLKGYICDTLFFEDQKLEIDPYYLGLWLGDGNRRSIRSISTDDIEIKDYLFSLGAEESKTHKYEILLPHGKFTEEFKSIYNLNRADSLEEKYIPNKYLINSVKNRLMLLAGILDSDGHYVEKGKYYDLTLKDYNLVKNIEFLCGSLGFKTNFRSRESKMNRKDGSVYSCTTYRLSIIPTNNLEIPVKIERKKHSKQSDFKNRRLTGITVEKDVVDNYYGFQLDGDNLFILEDFTITHNCGKTLTAAQTALDLLFKQEVEKIYVTRPTQQMGDSLGFLPGTLDQKLDPYLDPFKDNLYQCYDRAKIDKSMEEGRFEGFAIQFARGKTIKQGKILVCDESQNTTKHQMLGLLTRLGKGGRIIIIGDNEQKDIRDEYNGLSYAIELSKRIPEIKWVKLKENHRSDVVGKILDYEYNPRF